jgi:hypothetical protein
MSTYKTPRLEEKLDADYAEIFQTWIDTDFGDVDFEGCGFRG